MATTCLDFQEEVQHGLLYLNVLQASLSMWVKSSYGLETMKWACFRAAKPSEA